MKYPALFTTTAVCLGAAAAAQAQDCNALYQTYVAGGGQFTSALTLATADGAIECKYDATGTLTEEEIVASDGGSIEREWVDGVLREEELVLADGTRIEREYDSSGNLLAEEIERDDDSRDDEDEEDEDQDGDDASDGDDEDEGDGEQESDDA